LVRVYDTSKATLLHEFRRGADRATIYSIAFAATNEFLACSSDKGTVHVWAVPRSDEPNASETNDDEKKAAEHASSHANGPMRSPERSSEKTKTDAVLGVANAALSFAAGFLPANLGLAGERSVAQFKLPDFTKSLVAFGPEPQTLVVVTAEGTYYKGGVRV
jgi:WD40 repeat protein